MDLQLSEPMPVPIWSGRSYVFVTAKMTSRLGVGELLMTDNDMVEALRTSLQVETRIKKETKENIYQLREQVPTQSRPRLLHQQSNLA